MMHTAMFMHTMSNHTDAHSCAPASMCAHKNIAAMMDTATMAVSIFVILLVCLIALINVLVSLVLVRVVLLNVVLLSVVLVLVVLDNSIYAKGKQIRRHQGK